MNELNLSVGSHQSPSQGVSLMEAVSSLAGENWSNSPACTCPIIAGYARRLNDILPEAQRAHLVPFIPRLVGTRSTREIEQKRVYLALDMALRKFAPILLRATGERAIAETLECFGEIADHATAKAMASAVIDRKVMNGCPNPETVLLVTAGASAALSASTYVPNSAYESFVANTSNVISEVTLSLAADASAANPSAGVIPLLLGLLDKMIALSPKREISPDWFAHISNIFPPVSAPGVK